VADYRPRWFTAHRRSPIQVINRARRRVNYVDGDQRAITKPRHHHTVIHSPIKKADTIHWNKFTSTSRARRS